MVKHLQRPGAQLEVGIAAAGFLFGFPVNYLPKEGYLSVFFQLTPPTCGVTLRVRIRGPEKGHQAGSMKSCILQFILCFCFPSRRSKGRPQTVHGTASDGHRVLLSIGGLFSLAWLNIDGTDGRLVLFIYQCHLF